MWDSDKTMSLGAVGDSSSSTCAVSIEGATLVDKGTSSHKQLILVLGLYLLKYVLSSERILTHLQTAVGSEGTRVFSF